jgi:hypothetical protein
MPNKKITQLTINNNPSLSDVFPVVNDGITKQLSLTGLTAFIAPYIDTVNPVLTGGTYSDDIIVFTNNTGGTFSVTGLTSNVKHWLQNETKVLQSDETLVISGDYVLVNTNLDLQKDTDITIGNLTFNKYAQIYIGGNMLLLNSNIVNDGLINVAGAIIFSGNSTITGLGIII